MQTTAIFAFLTQSRITHFCLTIQELRGDNPFMHTQDTPKWEWKIMTARVNTNGKLRFDDIGYYWMTEKNALASLEKEGWELVKVLPLTATDTEDISHEKYIFKKNIFSKFFKKKSRNFFDTTLTLGKTYYFKRLIDH